MHTITIMGHLGRDPETRYTPSGQKVASFSIATNMRANGQDETVWWRISVWGNQFDKMLSYLKKGSAIIVTGRLSRPPSIYTDKNGVAKVSLDLNADRLDFPPFGRNQDQTQEQSFAPFAQSQPAASPQFTPAQTALPASSQGNSDFSSQVYPAMNGDIAPKQVNDTPAPGNEMNQQQHATATVDDLPF